ncbi:MAG TPA: hypothetical protein VI365_28255 [Trebonia sp.]
MTNQAIAGAAVRDGRDTGRVTVPDVTIRIAGALLALAVAAVHVADQGSVTGFSSPDWIGWSYRLIEVGGVLTALALLVPRPVPAWAGWAAGVLLGTGPFVAYILSRSVGVPGDPGDVGNWGYWVGTVSLFVEAALVMVSVSMLLSPRQSAAREGFRGLIGRAPRGHRGTGSRDRSQ